MPHADPPDLHRRRALGAHYSPRWVVDFVVRRTLDVALREPRFTPDDPPRICDPACGAGVFLLGAADRLAAWLRRRHPEATDRWRATRLGRALHGVDLDPTAVQSSVGALADFGLRAPHVVQGNSLLQPGDAPASWQGVDFGAAFSSARPGGLFDVVVGNPPFVDSEEMTRSAPALRRHLASRYRTAQGNWDLFCVFVERALELLAPGGYLGLILPNKLLSAGYASPTRALLAAQDLRLVRDYSAVRLFDAAVYPVVVVARRADARRRRGCVFEVVRGTPEALEVKHRARVAPGRVEAGGDAGWGRFLAAPRRRAHSPRIPLGDLVLIRGAATVDEAYRLTPLLRDGPPRGRSALRVVNTGTLDPHRSQWGERAMRYLGQSYLRPWVSRTALKRALPRRAAQASRSKVIVAGLTRHLECVYDPGGLLAAKSTTLLLVEDPQLGWTLAGLLNSAAARSQYRRQWSGLALANGYLRVGPPQLRALELPDPTGFSEQERSIVSGAALDLADLARHGVSETDSRWRRRISAIDVVCDAWYGLDRT